MKLSTQLTASREPAALAAHATQLEAAGLDLLWSPELYGHDAVSTLGFVAGRTSQVQLMTGIIPLYSRTPALIAQTAATLAALSEDRFVLGLGSSGPQVIEGWHGVAFDRPIARTRDTIDICRKVWRGERLVHDGDTISLPSNGGMGLGKALRFMGPTPTRRVPIALAALGPKNVELAAAEAEMWQTVHFVPELADQVWGGSLASGTARRDTSMPPLQIMAGGIVAIGDGAHIKAARRAARVLIGYSVGGMGARSKNFYKDLLARYGWEDEAQQIQDLFLAKRHEEAYAAVPDEYIELANLIGDESTVRQRIRAHEAAGVTHLDLQLHDPDPVAAIEKISEWTLGDPVVPPVHSAIAVAPNPRE